MIFKMIYLTYSMDPKKYYQKGSGSNGNKGVKHTLPISMTEALPSDAVQCHIQNTPFSCVKRFYPSAEDTVCMFKTPVYRASYLSHILKFHF